LTFEFASLTYLYIYEALYMYILNLYNTVITRKQWNSKTTLQQYLSVFEVFTKQIVL